MRIALALVSLSLLAVAAPALAQRADRSISLESGACVPLRAGERTAIPVALAASAWIEGDLEAVARIAYASVPQTGGRAAADLASGTLGLRWSAGTDAVRPQLEVEAGWARARRGESPSSAVALGAGIAVEWFLVRDLSLAARAALRRGALPGWRVDVTLGATAYF